MGTASIYFAFVPHGHRPELSSLRGKKGGCPPMGTSAPVMHLDILLSPTNFILILILSNPSLKGIDTSTYP